MMALMLLVCTSAFAKKKQKVDLFPDGTPIPEWFRQTDEVDISKLGKQYKITDYGVINDGNIYTKELQALIDKIATEGGGVVVVPQGTFKTGALFFKQGVHLHLLEGGTLMGSDDCSDFPIIKTRIEGETCLYYSALVNADGIDGFTISGKGTMQGANFASYGYGPEWFQHLTAIQTVRIEDGVTSICEDAFAGCTSLEIVNMPAAATVTGYAFQGCRTSAPFGGPQHRIYRFPAVQQPLRAHHPFSH